MKTPLFVFLKGLGMYTAVTLPAIAIPPMYLISLFYAVVYGWFAFAVFTVIWLITKRLTLSHPVRMLLLTVAVPVSVAFALQMIEETDGWDDVWHAGELLLFPLAAVIAGWIGLAVSSEQIKDVCKQEPGEDILDLTGTP